MVTFEQIEGARALARSRGVYREVNVYRRGEQLYVAHGKGFVRVITPKWFDKWRTSHPKIEVLEMEGV